MTKKWLMYVVTGLLCCGLIGLAVAKQNSKNTMTSRDRAKLELQSVQDNILKHGETPALQARKAELNAQLFGKTSAPIQKAAEQPSIDAQGEVVNNQSEVLVVEEMTPEKEVALYHNDLWVRFQNGEQLTLDEKAVLEDLSRANATRPNVDALDDQGGPNTFGYQWVDNLNGDTATFAWEEPTAPIELTTISNSDDAAANLPFGFTFNYFGVGYTSGWASTNGALAFDAAQTTYWINACPIAAFTNPALMPYNDDGHAGTGASSDGGRVVYQQYADHVTITWDSMGTCCTNGTDLLDYQVQLWNDGKIKYQYRQIQQIVSGGSNGISPIIGIQNSGQTDPLTYYCNSVGDANYTNALDGRAIWWFVNTAAVGRCCYYDGTEQCADAMSFDDCATLGGSFVINGTCANDPCELGRCCYDNGNSCGDFTEQHCNAIGGEWEAGLNCTSNPCPIVLPGGEACVDRVTVTPGQSWNSSTLDNSPEVGVPVCGSGYNTSAPGEWFSVIGTGNTMTVSLCDVATTYDSEIFVFCGDCDNLICIGGDDDFCATPGLASQLSWCSSLGQEYFILIAGFSGSGDYAAVLSDDGVPCTGQISCSVELGRCCYFDGVSGVCDDLIETACTSLGGTWTAGVSCATDPCVVGACCYSFGFCAEVTTEDCATLGGTYQGDGVLCENVVCPNPCAWDCDPLAIIEGDDFTGYCDASGANDFNGGCNIDPPAYTDIQCGDIVCANTFTCDATGFRDTDWYRFTITEWSDVTVTAQATFNNLLYGILNIDDCVSGAFFIVNGFVTDCSLGAQSVTALTLAPGTYAVFGGFGAFTGLPVPSQYQITLTCTPAAPPSGRCCYFDGVASQCVVNTSEECDLLSGYWTIASDCNTPCEIGRCCYDAGTQCGDVTLAECDFLAGNWDQFLSCALDPCPVPVNNDDCETAEEIVVVPNGSVTLASGAEGATNTCSDACDFSSSGPDQFYFITLTECRLIAIMADGTDQDAHLSIYGDGQCCITAFDCNDDWGNNATLGTYPWLPIGLRPTSGVGSMIADTLQAGTYYIRAAHFSTSWQGNYDLSVHDFGPCAIAPCDPIADLRVYVVQASQQGVNAQLHFTAPQDDDYKVWSSINPNNDGNPDDGADPDFLLEETLFGLTAGSQVWDAPAGFSNIKFYVVTAVCEPFQAPTGRCCYDNNASCGDITEAACTELGGTWDQFLSCANNPCPPPAPANDDCSGAIEVMNATPTNGSNLAAAVGADITTCVFNDFYDVWYYFVAPNTNLVTVTLCDAGTDFDTGLSVWSDCGGTELACNDDATCTFSSLQSTLTFTPAAAGTYYIRVAGYNSQTGNFVLTVTQ